MEPQQEFSTVQVAWRGQKFVVEINPSASLKELGEKLQELSNVDPHTMRLLVPSEKSTKLLYPFSDDHSILSLDSASLLLKGKSIRMMGVPRDEVDEVLQSEKANLRIAGFDEEERRLKQRITSGSHTSRKLPQGNYIFCDFQTLSLPGIELNPPASKALELLHKLASDPGIVAIMNKHRWRVGLLTEMAPIGYVGVSPKCILGLNKNHGEEISLRLRTDDLKGFRKYQSIKKTLLHELAHMVFSEHDSNFYALDKQLNDESAALDWTKSKGHSLSGFSHSSHYEEEEEEEEFDDGYVTSHKLGGQASFLPNARAASVNAAFERLANASANLSGSSEESIVLLPSDVHSNLNAPELDPDVSKGTDSNAFETYVESSGRAMSIPMDLHHNQGSNSESERCEQSDINTSGTSQMEFTIPQPELDDSGVDQIHLRSQNAAQPDQTSLVKPAVAELPNHLDEPRPSDSLTEYMQSDPDSIEATPMTQATEPDPQNTELQIIQDPVTTFCNRLQNGIQSLKYEAKPSEAAIVLQTLIKIIRNIIEHPEDIKFKRLRKSNPVIQKNIICYKAAVDILTMIGFCEDVIVDEWGKTQVFFMLKRNDPGLLWLAKSSLETHVA